MFGCASGKNVDRVCHRSSRIELRLEFIGLLPLEGRYLHAALGESVCQHDTWTSCVSDDGKPVELGSGQRRQTREDAANRGQFLAREAAHYASLAEESLHG